MFYEYSVDQWNSYAIYNLCRIRKSEIEVSPGWVMTRGVTLKSSLSRRDPAIKRLNEYRSSWWWNFYSRDHHANRDKYTRAENNGPVRVFLSPCPLSCLSECLGNNGMRQKVWLAACQHSLQTTMKCAARETLCRPTSQWVGWCKKIRTDFITELERNTHHITLHVGLRSHPRPRWAPVAPGQLHWAALCLVSSGSESDWFSVPDTDIRHRMTKWHAVNLIQSQSVDQNTLTFSLSASEFSLSVCKPWLRLRLEGTTLCSLPPASVTGYSVRVRPIIHLASY